VSLRLLCACAALTRPCSDLFERDEATGKTFVLRPKRTSLSARLRGADTDFVAFVATLLCVDPELRPTAAEALRHPWLCAELDPEAVPPH
jgi:serine/threonine protein kinase